MFRLNFPHKLSYVLFCVLYLCSSCNTERKNEKTDPPNIILINVDDLGYGDTEIYGNSDFDTPHILQLASQGMTFTNAYAAAANCAPSRACLLTGQYSPRHGVYTVGSSERGHSKDRKLIPVENIEVLGDSVITLAHEFQRNGYRTMMIGKWHLGDDPSVHGFDVNIAGNHAGHPKSYFSPYGNPDLADGPEGEYLTDRLTREAISLIEKSDEPFFLYLAYYAVHTPLQGKPELVAKYLEQGMEDKTARYAAMVENLDTNLGLLFKSMDRLKLIENTLIVFTSDNGGIAAIHPQLPWRAGKGSYFEGGIRVPMIVSWPGKIPSGSISDLPVINLDLYPTLLSISGIDPQNPILDGMDISREWNGDKMNRERSLFWHFPVYLQAYDGKTDDARDELFRTRPGTALRMGPWKIHHYFESDEWELYHLESDPGERMNLWDQETDVGQKLKAQLESWRQETNAAIPTQPNPEFER